MKLFISIVPKSLSDDVSAIIGGEKIDFQTTIPALGTAPSEILEALSLGEAERDLILSIVDDDDIEKIFERLKNELDFLKSGHGVAFTLPMNAITKMGSQYLYHQLPETEEN